MNTLKILAICAAATLMTTGCKTTTTTTAVTLPAAGNAATPPLTPGAQRLEASLTGEWKITSVNGTPVTVAGEDGGPQITFTPNATNPALLDLIAYNGCNYTNGTLALGPNGTVTRQGDFAQTMRLCGDAPYEMAITEALNNMTQLAVVTGPDNAVDLVISAGSRAILTARRHNLAFLDGAWRVAMIADEAIPADNAPQLVFDLQEGTLHGNAGCNTLNARLTLNDAVANGITVSDPRTTRMTCPDIEREGRLLEALRMTVSATPGDNGRALLRDAQGGVILTLQRIPRADL